VGQCNLTLRHEDPYWLSIPHLLAAFIFWCGTGRKTTQGLGRTRAERCRGESANQRIINERRKYHAKSEVES
jgi:hypothetical protein